jgi:hypothetical protein
MSDSTYSNTSSAWLQLLAALNAEGNLEYQEEHELPALLRPMAE